MCLDRKVRMSKKNPKREGLCRCICVCVCFALAQLFLLLYSFLLVCGKHLSCKFDGLENGQQHQLRQQQQQPLRSLLLSFEKFRIQSYTMCMLAYVREMKSRQNGMRFVDIMASAFILQMLKRFIKESNWFGPKKKSYKALKPIDSKRDGETEEGMGER